MAKKPNLPKGISTYTTREGDIRYRVRVYASGKQWAVGSFDSLQHARTGSAEGLGDSLFSCRCCGGCVHHGFEFDRSQTSQACLSAPTMIGPFDPGHDRTA